MGKSLARPALGLAVVCLGTVGAALDSAVNIALPSISGAFGIEIQDIRWIVVAYVLTYSSLLLIFGKRAKAAAAELGAQLRAVNGVAASADHLETLVQARAHAR